MKSFLYCLLALGTICACSGERNIDVEDRQRRLSLPDIPGPGESNNSEESKPAQKPFLTSFYVYSVAALNETVYYADVFPQIVGLREGVQIYRLYFDTQSERVLTTGEGSKVFEVGRFHCIRSQGLCASFSFDGVLVDIDKITGFPRIPPDTETSQFRLIFTNLHKKYELFQVINGAPQKIETAISAQFSTSVNDAVGQLKYILFQTAHGSGLVLAKRFKDGKDDFNFDFQCKELGDPWVFSHFTSDQQGPDLKMSCFFVNSRDLSVNEIKYLVKHAQN